MWWFQKGHIIIIKQTGKSAQHDLFNAQTLQVEPFLSLLVRQQKYIDIRLIGSQDTSGITIHSTKEIHNCATEEERGLKCQCIK